MSDHELSIREKIYLIAAVTHVLACDESAVNDAILLSASEKLVYQARVYEMDHPGTMDSIDQEFTMVKRLRGDDD